MSTSESVRFQVQRPSMERSFRQALTDPQTREDVKAAVGWDDSQVSRFLSGQSGLTIDKLDAAISALSLRIVTKRYLDAMGVLCVTGANCHCAREGLGNCGMV